MIRHFLEFMIIFFAESLEASRSMLRALKKNQSEHPPLELMKHSLIEAAEYRIQVGT